ncbi:hypothetical protein IGJ02_000112 [Enterococcus sp. DIV0724b]|uniref:hypothetical protein n=1 Tax=Enterococcus sp. DIV0724b TaxID=2774694 RepID=UPI003D2FFC23
MKNNTSYSAKKTSLLLAVSTILILMLSLIVIDDLTAEAMEENKSLTLTAVQKKEMIQLEIKQCLNKNSLDTKEFELSLEVKELQAYDKQSLLDQTKIISEKGQEYTDATGVTKRLEENKLIIGISPEASERLRSDGNQSVSVKSTLKINKNDEQLMKSYHENEFRFSFVAKNNKTQEKVETVCAFNVTPPTAKAIPTTVSAGSSTAELSADKLVTDLKSDLEFDEVNVLGVEEFKKFDQVGDTKIAVMIQSEETQRKSRISIPIKVEKAKSNFYTSELTTIMNEEGDYKSGKPIEEELLRDTVVLQYLGKSFLDDVTFTKEGRFVSWKSLGGEEVKLAYYDSIEIKNVAYKDGEYLNLYVNIRTKDGVYIPKFYNKPFFEFASSAAPIYPGVPAAPGKPFLLEVMVGTALNHTLEGVNIIFPIVKENPDLESSLDFSLDSLQNIAVVDDDIFKKDLEANTFTSGTKEYYKLFWPKKNMAYNPYVFTLLYKNMSFQWGKAMQFGIFDVPRRRIFGILDTTAKINVPVKYQKAEIEGKINQTNGKIEAELHQFLPKQGSSKYYEPLSLDINLSKYAGKLDEANTKIKITDDKTNNDWSKNAEVTYSTTENGEQVAHLNVSKDLLEQLGKETGAAIINIAVEAPLSLDAALMDVYDASNLMFKIPVNVSNERGISESVSSVQMPKPTAQGVPQMVELGTTVSDLNASDFVKDLKSILPFDTIEVVGFKGEKVFDKLGKTTVEVTIKSKATNALADIEVEVTVVENPLAYITTNKSIELKNEGQSVEGSGAVSFTGQSDARIQVYTEPVVQLKNSDDKNLVDLNVRRKGSMKPLKSGELLAELTPANRSSDFKLSAPESKFKNTDVYKGNMTIHFEVSEYGLVR